jgi:hypothetical protein
VQKQHHTTEVKAETARGAETAPVIDVAISVVSKRARAKPQQHALEVIAKGER